MINLTQKPKRKRICGPQSKNGCLTCKARRVKCDERKPDCLRCAESGRVCEGYKKEGTHEATGSPLLRKNSSKTIFDITALLDPKPVFTSGYSGSELQQRCAQHGIDMLMFDSFRSFGASGVVIDMLLVQTFHSIPSVYAAATALGAVYQMQALYKSGSPLDQGFAISQYQVALRSAQRDLETQPNGPIPLILVCFLLSTVELLLQRDLNALLHLKGACRLLQHQQKLRESSGQPQSNNNLISQEGHIDIVLHAIDSQTCSYALSKPPELPTVAAPLILPTTMDLSSAHVVLVRLIHACYKFTSTNYTFKYQPQFADAAIYIQQGRLIAHLSIWLESFNLTVLPALCRDRKSAHLYSHALTLRMSALSTLIHLACVLSPYETAYDAHASRFEQIIADGETLISNRKDPNWRSFAAGPGVVQPLFMVAYKYRHPLHRRRAICLLSSAGCEGLWSGPREARITSRIMDIEEGVVDNASNALEGIFPRLRSGRAVSEGLNMSDAADIMTARHSLYPIDGLAETSQASLNACSCTKVHTVLCNPTKVAGRMTDIKELARIHGIGLSVDNEVYGAVSRVNVRFTRCLNLQHMLSYWCGHESSGNKDLDPHTQGPCVDNIHWEIWTETLEY